MRVLYRWLPICLAVGVMLTAGPTYAQDATPATTPAPTAPEAAAADRPAEPAPEALAAPRPGDVIFLPDANGKAVPVPVGASLLEYLRAVRQRALATGEESGARYAIGKLELTGEAQDEWARVSVDVRIRVLATEGWVRVPLAMGEALLREAKHEGVGEGVIEPWDQVAGNAALLRGAGEHLLKLELSVPIRKTSPGKRVQLSLPGAAVSSARLTIPQSGVQVRGADRTAITVDSSSTGSVVTATGLGARLDLSWQTPIETTVTETRWEVWTQALVNFVEGTTALWDLTLRIQPAGGVTTATTLRVRLPAGSELVSLDGTELAEWKADPADKLLINIKLRRPPTGPFELRWTLRSTSADALAVTLAGPRVEQVVQQAGLLAIAGSGDARVSAEGAAPVRLQRVGTADLPAPLRHPQLALAYRVLGDDWSVPVRLVPTTPFIAVEPEVRVALRDNELECQVRVRGRVYRSGVTQLKYLWPEATQAGWTVDVTTGGVSLEPVAGPEGGGVLRFPEPVRNEFDLRFRVRGPLPEGPGGAGRPLTLPRFEVDEQSPTTLVLVVGESQSVRLEPGGGVSVRRLRTADRTDERSLEAGQRVDGVYLVEGKDRIRLTLSTTTEPATIDVDSVLELSGVERKLGVTQRFRYRVSHGRLNRLKLQAPPEKTLAAWKFFGPDGRELVPETTGVANAGVLAFPPGQPVDREFTVEARYRQATGAVELPIERGTIEIPLLRSLDVAHHGCQLVWRSRGGDGLTLTDAAWQPEPDGELETTRTWRAVTTPASVSAVYDRVVPDFWRRVSVSRAWLNTEVEMDGTLRTHAHYRIVNCPATFPLTLPADARLTAVRWNLQSQPLPTPVARSAAGDQFLLSAPITGGEQLLSLDLEVKPETGLTFSDALSIDPPRFARELWIAQIYWQLTLPDSQHLLTLPEGWTSQNEWRLTGFLFGRRPVMTQVQLEQWVGVKVAQTGERLDRVGHRYLFTGGSVRRPLAARTMSRSVLILFGAGSALLLGFVLVQVRGSRTVFTFLALAFVLAVVGLWHAEVVAVLFQPALLGVSLAALTAWFDGLIQRRRDRRVLDLATPDGQPELVDDASGALGGALPGPGAVPGLGTGENAPVVGSEDFTAIRGSVLPAPPETTVTGARLGSPA